MRFPSIIKFAIERFIPFTDCDKDITFSIMSATTTPASPDAVGIRDINTDASLAAAIATESLTDGSPSK
jgi:hypothetical protein